MSAKDFSIIMAYDAFRICIGQRPKHDIEDVLRWIRLMAKQFRAEGKGRGDG